MDLLELIKCYNMEHKSLFTAFMILLPVLFTILYMYVPAFQGMELYVQAIFSATASIFCVYISYLFVIIAHRAAGLRYKPGYLFLLLGSLIASFILIFFPENYNLGYGYVIRTFLHVYIFCYGFFAIASIIIRACANCFIYCTKNKIDKSNSASESDKERKE